MTLNIIYSNNIYISLSLSLYIYIAPHLQGSASKRYVPQGMEDSGYHLNCTSKELSLQLREPCQKKLKMVAERGIPC